MGLPVPSFWKDSSARFDTFTSQTEACHHELMSSHPHLYVTLLGVSPSAQGKGVGKRLIRALVAISEGLPIYLECNEGNIAFYSKQGFKLLRQMSLQPKGDAEPFPFAAMLLGSIPNGKSETDLQSSEKSKPGAWKCPCF